MTSHKIKLPVSDIIHRLQCVCCEIVVKIAEVKYLKEEEWRVVWIFDHSSCHAAMSLQKC